MLACEKVAMEQFGDVFNRVVLTHPDGKRHVVDADRDRAVEGLGQLNDDVPQRLGGRYRRYDGVEPPHGKGLPRGHVGRVEVVGVLLLERESKRGRTDLRNGDHEDSRTRHTAIEQRTVPWRIGKMPE